MATCVAVSLVIVERQRERQRDRYIKKTLMTRKALTQQTNKNNKNKILGIGSDNTLEKCSAQMVYREEKNEVILYSQPWE